MKRRRRKKRKDTIPQIFFRVRICSGMYRRLIEENEKKVLLTLGVFNPIMTEPRSGYGSKDGSQRGYKEGGRGRNRTSVCRNPTVKKRRK